MIDTPWESLCPGYHECATCAEGVQTPVEWLERGYFHLDARLSCQSDAELEEWGLVRLGISGMRGAGTMFSIKTDRDEMYSRHISVPLEGYLDNADVPHP